MADETEIFIECSLREKLIGYSKSSENTSKVLFLYGNVYGTSIHITGCINSTILKVSVGRQSFECDFIPRGIQFLGICYFNSKFKEIDLIPAKALLKDLLTEKPNERIHEQLLLWQHCLDTSNDYGIVYDTSNSKLAECQLNFDSYLERFSQHLLAFRIQTTFDVCVESKFKALNHKINKLAIELQSESTTYLVKDFKMFLNCEASKDQIEQSCTDLLGLVDDSNGLEASSPENRKTKSRKTTSKNSNKTSVIKDAVDVKILTKVSMSPATYKDNSMTPIICYGEECGTDISLSLPVDVVVMVTKSTKVSELPRLFTSAVSQQLKHIQNVIQGFSKDDNWCVPRPYHFKLPGSSHYVTILYPEIDSHGQGIDEQTLELYRTEIHKHFLLPLNKPLIRICNRYTFEKDRKPELYLINPHAGISSSGLSGGTLGLVDGRYSYHHYMQDNFNDDKWGCAYRSLQTIFSWFRHQGYTTKPVPSHKQIQQALVDVGDKKSNFVGSRQWIGSFEVNLCLEHLLGITSKIMFVSSGAEMSSKGRELLYHFQTQGTPIMIGGGVLAHTIIGVDYNQQTGDIKFLILDPHYTGSEDLKIVLDKGWCGWKGPGFWDQQAHYNMCMPQRPDVI